jgi:GDPmannose 4,6-dehydratase
LAFSHAGLDYEQCVESNPKYYRPGENHLLVGDAGKARAVLAWEPTVTLEALVPEMVEADLRLEAGRQ